MHGGDSDRELQKKKVVAETIEEPTAAEMVEEEPLLDQELLQEAEKIPELDQSHL